ncbi:MAG: hypothetical protein GX483_01710 [Actinomycetaceae bacterium]|nr:hypothetical protein [Actinomycetaceae bacterium]
MKTSTMALMLTKARLQSRKGSTLLDVFALIAYAVSATLILTTLGGVWMFWQRAENHIEHEIATLMGTERDMISDFAFIHVTFAFLALALLAIPLLSVGAGAARLGANGRAQRLASLRLLGVSGRQVMMMSVLETSLLASLGFLMGLFGYIVTMPLWSNITFQMIPIRQGEMMLTWWQLILAYLLFVAITVISTLTAHIQVSISPLGVARRHTPQALRAWRLAVLVLAIGLVTYTTSDYSPFASGHKEMLTMVASFVIFFASFSLVGPWFIQLVTRLLVRGRSASTLLATRRVVGDPRGAWRGISAVALMSLVATIVTTTVEVGIEVETTDEITQQVVQLTDILLKDISVGVLIAFGFALILSAVSTLIHQTADVFDRQEEAESLAYIGTPLRTLHVARIKQVLGPLVLSLVISLIVGYLPPWLSGISVGDTAENSGLLLTMYGLGIGLTLLSVAATIPVQHRVLAERGRRND